MKTLLTIIVLLLAFFQIQAQQIWTEVYQYPSNDPVKYNDIYFSSQNTGYALGSINAQDVPIFILKTTDGGQTWSEIYYSTQLDFNGFLGREVFFSTTAPQNGVIINTDYNLTYSIYRTIDGGQSWTEKFIPDIDGINAVTIANGILFLHGKKMENGNVESHFYTSNDFGHTWNLQYIGNQDLNLLKLSFINSQIGYGQNHTEVYKTTDAGQTWQKTGEFQNPNTGIPEIVSDIVFKNNQIGFSGGGYVSQFMKTSDGGQSWSPLLIDNGQQPPIETIVLYNNAVYGSSHQLFRSLDMGITWIEITSNGKIIMQLFDEYTGIAVWNGYGKIYMMDTSSLSIENPKPEKKIKVYPNPAENTLNIEIAGQLSIEKICLTDMQGRLVKEYTGNFSKLDVSNVAAGNYLLQVYSGSGRMTKKIVVE